MTSNWVKKIQRIIRRLCRIDETLDAVYVAAIINARDMENLMATVLEMKTSVDAMSAAVGKIGADVTEAVAAIKALPGGGSGIDPADLDPIKARVDTAATDLAAFSAQLQDALHPGGSNPPPPPPPPQPGV